MTYTRLQRSQLRRENKTWPHAMTAVPVPWPAQPGVKVLGVWRSQRFFAQFVCEESGAYRLSINRTGMLGNGRWVDAITWDELQQVKSECGFGDIRMVEVYPEDDAVINVANIRHLFICTHPVGWRLEGLISTNREAA